MPFDPLNPPKSRKPKPKRNPCTCGNGALGIHAVDCPAHPARLTMRHKMSEASARHVALALIEASQWFAVEPLPDGVYEVSVKDDDNETSGLVAAVLLATCRL